MGSGTTQSFRECSPIKLFRDSSKEPERDQLYLLPPSVRDWLPENHDVWFYLDAMDELDLSSIYEAYADLGQPPYSPKMMVTVWAYAYASGIRSSRKVEKALHESVPFRVLAGNLHPDHWTLNNFRKRHEGALKDLFLQTVRLARKSGAIGGKHVAVDGTKLQGNASKRKAMSYDRMQKEEKRLKEEIDRFFDEADAIDAEEDRTIGPGRGDELPKHLMTQKKRLEAIREAKKALEEEARQKKQEEQDERKRVAEQEGREFHPRTNPEEATPNPKAQRNFTDPESRIMKGSGQNFIQGYNGQAAVDSKNQIIVAADLTNQAVDNPHLPGLIDQTVQNLGDHPREASADAGYYSENNLAHLVQIGIEAYIPPSKVKHSEFRNAVSPRGRIPKDLSPADRMRRKLKTKKGREHYALRMKTVEPVFGQMKGARGLIRLARRGLEAARSCWFFECAVHNLAKLCRLAAAARAATTSCRKVAAGAGWR